MVAAHFEVDTVALECENLTVLISKTLRACGSYLEERRSDRVYNNVPDPAEEVGPAVDSHHHKRTAADLGDRTGTVRVETSKHPAEIRNLSVL